MNFLKTIQWVVWKDLISELRSRETLSSMLFFALIVILVFSFSFSMDQDAARELIAGIIWVAFAFTGIIGLGKSFSAELQNDCLEYLQISPTSKGAIYLGKMASNLLFMLVVEVLLFPLFVVFFNLDVIEEIGLLLLIFFFSDTGSFSSGHALFGANGSDSSEGSHASRPASSIGRACHDCRRRSHTGRVECRPVQFVCTMVGVTCHL